jgi:Wzt C-terminal domain
VMIQVDADILLIDEVLAVGDAAFQQKCFDEFVRIRDAGKTILLVTHDMAAVHRFCDRAMLLERGRVVEVGDPDTVGNRYLEINFSELARDDAAHEREPASLERMGDGDAEILEAWFEDEAGEPTASVPSGGRCAFAARVRFVRPVEDPLFGVVLQNDQRDTILAASTLWSNPTPGRFEAGREIAFRVTFENLLVPGRYYATPAVARQGSGIAWIDRRERMAALLVSGVARTDAIVDLPYDVQVRPVTGSPAREEVTS